MAGDPGQPYRASVPYVDFGTALALAFGTLAVLMERNRTGKGQIVEGALLRTALYAQRIDESAVMHCSWMRAARL